MFIAKVYTHKPNNKDEAEYLHFANKDEAMAHKGFWNSQGARVKIFANWLELPVINGTVVYPDNYRA